MKYNISITKFDTSKALTPACQRYVYKVYNSFIYLPRFCIFTNKCFIVHGKFRSMIIYIQNSDEDRNLATLFWVICNKNFVSFFNGIYKESLKATISISNQVTDQFPIFFSSFGWMANIFITWYEKKHNKKL